MNKKEIEKKLDECLEIFRNYKIKVVDKNHMVFEIISKVYDDLRREKK